MREQRLVRKALANAHNVHLVDLIVSLIVDLRTGATFQCPAGLIEQRNQMRLAGDAANGWKRCVIYILNLLVRSLQNEVQTMNSV